MHCCVMRLLIPRAPANRGACRGDGLNPRGCRYAYKCGQADRGAWVTDSYRGVTEHDPTILDITITITIDVHNARWRHVITWHDMTWHDMVLLHDMTYIRLRALCLCYMCAVIRMIQCNTTRYTDFIVVCMCNYV